jgi:hypothetical protein
MLAINVLMSFGAVAVAAGIIALEPAFSTGAALGVTLAAIGLAISFFANEQSRGRGSQRTRCQHFMVGINVTTRVQPGGSCKSREKVEFPI